jgi:hypothetical protein
MKQFKAVAFLSLFGLVLWGCNSNPSSPQNETFSKANMTYSYDKTDTIPSVFIKMLPLIAEFNEDSSGYVKVKVGNNHAFSIIQAIPDYPERPLTVVQ